MKELNETPRNLRAVWVPMTLAALVMALLVAAVVNVNSTQAQGPGLGIGGDLNKIEYEPPFPCNGDDAVPSSAAATIDTEHYAVFDAFWDYNNSRLSNNFCPPGAEHTIIRRPGRSPITETARTESNIDIRKTVFSISNANKADVVDTVTTSTSTREISRGIYQFLPAGSDEVWWLEEDNDTTLGVGFSTGLLKADHWTTPEGETHPVQFEFEAIERPGAHGGEEAHFFVFETRTAPVDVPLWDSSETDTHQMQMNTGEYKHVNWVFTHPGIYKIQLQVKAHVKHPSPLGIPIEDETLTSVARLYTFHVGHDDDLGVSITPKTQTVAASATSTSFAVKATNGGPDNAGDAEVQIYLPEGLGYMADSSHTGVTYDSGSGVIAWDLGQLAPTVSSTTPTLNFSASIDRTKATGTVTVRAEIRNVANNDLDPNGANNVSFSAVRLSSAHVHPPIFTVACEIEEFASSFERVCEQPVTAFSPEGLSLTYSLSGRGHEKFKVLGDGQIIVANNVELEYEKQWSYWLTLKASDGTNTASILVKIRVVNVPEPKVRIWLEDERLGPEFPAANLMHPSATDGSNFSLNAKVHNLPAGKNPSGCTWDSGSGSIWSGYGAGFCDANPGADSAGPETYTVNVGWDGGSAAGAYTINWAP